MTQPDPLKIPTLDDLVFPSDRSLIPRQEPANPAQAELPFSNHRSDVSLETSRGNEPSQEERLEPDFLIDRPSESTEVFAFEAEPSLPVFGAEESTRSTKNPTKADSRTDKSDPSFGNYVRIHSLAIEESNIPFMSSNFSFESGQEDAKNTSHQPGKNSPRQEDDQASETIIGKLPSSMETEIPPTPRLSNEEIVACVEATVRRAFEAELPQLTQRVTTEVLRVLQITLG